NGSGKRQFVSHVDFDEWYQKKPTVIVSLAGFDSTGRKAISVKAININERGFDLVLTTLGQSQVSSLWVNWVAFGNND
ncbi:MAG: H-type lectin domain-containing protein, partial [Trichodesmium sp. St18_bin1]|nr:H-type lectin domain-containing protein [Trichodesmium sp. St18_bin1]MDE5119354.1 H-type lectin domain-containing protein [Trichodesmium sp. St19_bin1]